MRATYCPSDFKLCCVHRIGRAARRKNFWSAASANWYNTAGGYSRQLCGIWLREIVKKNWGFVNLVFWYLPLFPLFRAPQARSEELFNAETQRGKPQPKQPQMDADSTEGHKGNEELKNVKWGIRKTPG